MGDNDDVDEDSVITQMISQQGHDTSIRLGYELGLRKISSSVMVH